MTREADGIDWGVWSGRRRLPCPEDPVALTGAPIGMYHCPTCGEMQLAGLPHSDTDPDYEATTGHEWPPGYAATPTERGTL